MIRKIDHIAIAVRDLAAALRFWEETLGLKATGTEVVEEQKVRVAFLPVGESKIELLEPTDPEGPVGKFLARSGEGVHHIALRVDDVSAELARLKGLGVRLIDEEPRRGAGGARIAFIHPKATLGVLLELCQRDEGGLE